MEIPGDANLYVLPRYSAENVLKYGDDFNTALMDQYTPIITQVVAKMAAVRRRPKIEDKHIAGSLVGSRKWSVNGTRQFVLYAVIIKHTCLNK